MAEDKGEYILWHPVQWKKSLSQMIATPVPHPQQGSAEAALVASSREMRGIRRTFKGEIWETSREAVLAMASPRTVP